MLKNKVNVGYHLLLWGLIFYLHIHFLQNFVPLKPAILHTLLYLSYLAIVFYFHTYFLAPRFFNRKKIIYYLLLVVTLLIISKIISDLAYQYASLRLEELNEYHNPHGDIGFLFSGTLSTIFVSFIVWFIIKYRDQEKQKKELQTQKSLAELAMLKSQINPHFLFNALNNIYALSLEKSDPIVSELILSLSEINRYMVYESQPDFVSVEKEISYLNSYIELEKLRCEKKSNINVSLEKPPKHVKIAPLLLIPFIENAFKHSRIVDDTKAIIDIKLNFENNVANFICKNTIPSRSFNKDKVNGIGLENVKRRLELLYPNKYNLNILEEDGLYIVKLKLQT